MSESDPSDNSLELQPFIQNLESEQQETVRTLSGSGGNVELHLTVHQTFYNSTVVKGDVIRGTKTDVKDSNLQTLSVSNDDSSSSGPSQSQALSEPLVQAALPWTEGEERDAEECNDEKGENIERTAEAISSARMQMPVEKGNGTQTNTDTFDTESRTVKISYREGIARTNEELRFDIEAQTDSPRTQDRILHTDNNAMDGGSQTFLLISQRSNAYAQTVKIVSSDTDVQTEILKLTTNQTQTEIKSYENEKIQTDIVETLDANSQTDKQALLEILPAIMKGLAAVEPNDENSVLAMIELYNTEKTEQDIGNLLPLLETIWKSIQVKIALKSIESQLARGSKIQLDDNGEQNLLTFISRVDDVVKIGKQFASENNFIHAVISFYIAAKLHKLGNKSTNSLAGIRDCVFQVVLVVKEMAKQPEMKNIVIDHVIPLMHEMKSNIQSIQDLSRHDRVDFEAFCLRYIGNCYTSCGE